MDHQAFEQIVAIALESLPDFFRERLENIEVTVENWPDSYTLQLAKVRHPAELLGFYHGVPLAQRSLGYNLVLPDKITLYQQPIEMRCRTREELCAMVSHVLKHEIAHHFGLDDQQLREIGAY